MSEQLQQLKQVEIQAILRESGVQVNRIELKDYLLNNHHRISGLNLRHCENVDRNGRNNHWYEILSNVPQDSANKRVANQLLNDRAVMA